MPYDRGIQSAAHGPHRAHCRFEERLPGVSRGGPRFGQVDEAHSHVRRVRHVSHDAGVVARTIRSFERRGELPGLSQRRRRHRQGRRAHDDEP